MRDDGRDPHIEGNWLIGRDTYMSTYPAKLSEIIESDFLLNWGVVAEAHFILQMENNKSHKTAEKNSM